MNICLTKINKSYQEGGKNHLILDDMTAQFYSNQFTIILGKSGTGKSTLLNLISGIDTPDEGTIRIGDTNITNLSDYERTLFRRRNIGFVFQFFNLIPTLTVLENVTLVSELDGKLRRKQRQMAESILEQVGLKDRLKAMPDQLSGGEQQRIAIARALAHEPEIILADEPTGNLDNENGMMILDMMLKLIREKGKTLVMVSHSSESLEYAHRVFNIKTGKLVPVILDRNSSAF
jgi:putative ABC transport system ATP-binding protein